MHRAPDNDLFIPIRETRNLNIRESSSIVRASCCELVELMNSIAMDKKGKM